VEWPAGIGAKGNEGAANNVLQTQGAIGYVEYAYAKQNKMTFVDMINKDGKTVAPNAEGFKAAAANADWANAVSYYVILTDEPGAKSWPGLWNMTSGGGVAVEIGIDHIVKRAEFDSCDTVHADVAVGVGPDDDLAELLGR
jgi:hypothetical protein